MPNKISPADNSLNTNFSAMNLSESSVASNSSSNVSTPKLVQPPTARQRSISDRAWLNYGDQGQRGRFRSGPIPLGAGQDLERPFSRQNESDESWEEDPDHIFNSADFQSQEMQKWDRIKSQQGESDKPKFSSLLSDKSIVNLKKHPTPATINVQSLLNNSEFIKFMDDWGLDPTDVAVIKGADDDDMGFTDTETGAIEISTNAFDPAVAFDLPRSNANRLLKALSGIVVTAHEASHKQFLQLYPPLNVDSFAFRDYSFKDQRRIHKAKSVYTNTTEVLAHQSEVRNLNAYLDRHSLSLNPSIVKKIGEMRQQSIDLRNDYFLSLCDNGEQYGKMLLEGKIWELITLSQRDVLEQCKPNSPSRIEELNK